MGQESAHLYFAELTDAMWQHNRRISIPLYRSLIGSTINTASIATNDISPLLRQVAGNRACKSEACFTRITRTNNGNCLPLQNLQITEREKDRWDLAARNSFLQQERILSIKYSNQTNMVVLKLLYQKSLPDKLLFGLPKLLHHIC